ncbi:TetR/AcrR family transcriptional regulator [Iamia majanohamensis]|uniref:TetR/AcrR family transcriptional regulator n=1 Tax=Iamia majanohamensis TaxID=467976 RepID=A0AAE9Y6C2_9ACTN|nr:TetR/AcrR family transcriptional regulator [Iamia majanohamensis]WCO67730.1 TetR/AcrR family transcriptional regulator [Iamia majanohamensis]
MTPSARTRARRGEGDRLRDEILAAASDLLVETASEDAVSIRAVAQRVGVTPPSIYRHFADKDRLLLEVCHRSFDRFAAALDASATDEDVVARMASLGRAYVHYAIDHPEHYRIMFMARYDLSAQEYAEEMVSDETSFGLLLRTTEELIATGRVRPDLAERGPLHLGILFWSTVHGLASLLVAKPGLPWPDRDLLVTDLVGAVIRGLLVEIPG